MKKSMLTCAVLALVAAVSCTEKYELPKEPDVVNPTATVLTADIAAYGDPHSWSREDAFGVYGSESGENVRYAVASGCYGQTGTARLFGPGAEGDLTAYYPYSSAGCPAAIRGRQPLGDVQLFRKDAVSQIKDNSVLVAVSPDGYSFPFHYLTGVLQLKLALEVDGRVQSVKLASPDAGLCGDLSLDGTEPLLENAGTAVSVEGIDLPCSSAEPLDVFFMLPAGTYAHLSVTVFSSSETVTKPIDVSVAVAERTSVSCTVTEKETIYNGSDLVIINGEFD